MSTDHNSCPSPTSRERKWRSTFRAIFSSPSLIPAYVVGNSRRSGPRTTHTLYLTSAADAATVAVVGATPSSTPPALPESSIETKNCGRGYPCILQYSYNSSLPGDGGGVGFAIRSGGVHVIANGSAGVEDDDEDDEDDMEEVS